MSADTLPVRRATRATCLALTWLNPHVYPDTVVLVGSGPTQFASNQSTLLALVDDSLLIF